MKFSINTHVLIGEIEKRPAIWDMTISEYSDKLARKRCWEELTDMFSSAKATEKEKIAMSELLQKKWKNIRDRFSRDMKTGENLQYMYSEQLQFLQRTVRQRQKSAKSTVTDDSEVYDAADTSSRSASDFIYALEEESKPPPQKWPRTDSSVVASASKKKTSAYSMVLDDSEEESKPPPPKRPKTDNSLAAAAARKKPSASTMVLDESEEESKPSRDKRSRTDNILEAKLLELLERNSAERQEKTKDSQDEDRLFLMSLITNMKSIPPHYKLKAKIEILSVLDKYSKVYEELDIVDQPQIVEINSILP